MQVRAYKLGLSWSVKVLSVLNDNTRLQFLKMIHSEATDTGRWHAGLQKMPGIILSFMTNRNTNNLWARSVAIDHQVILAAPLSLHPGDAPGLRPPLLWSLPNKCDRRSGLALDGFKVFGIWVSCGTSEDVC